MRKNFGYFLLLLPVLAAVLFLYDDPVVWVFAGSALLAPVVSLIQLVMTVPFVRAEASLSGQEAETGQEIKLSLYLENDSVFPVVSGWVLLKIRGSEGKVFCKKKIPVQIPPRGSVRAETVFSCSYCGVLKLSAARICCSDFIRLFVFSKHIRKGEAELAVLPPALPVQMGISRAASLFQGDAQEYDPNRPGNDPAEVFDVHEYMPGDRLQQVHWKLSARGEELLVKDFSRPVDCPVLLLADMPGKGMSPEEFDGIVRTVMSLSAGLTAEKCPHQICWPSEVENQMEERTVRGEEDTYVWGEQVIRQNFTYQFPPLVRALENGMIRKQFHHIYLITGRPDGEAVRILECLPYPGARTVLEVSPISAQGPSRESGRQVEWRWIQLSRTEDCLKELYLEV